MDYTNSELARLRRLAERDMTDVVQILVYSGNADDYGQVSDSYANGNIMPCTYIPAQATETDASGVPVVTTAPQVILPYRALGMVTFRDRLKILTRNRQPLHDSMQPVFQVVGDPQIGDTLITASLQQVHV